MNSCVIFLLLTEVGRPICRVFYVEPSSVERNEPPNAHFTSGVQCGCRLLGSGIRAAL